MLLRGGQLAIAQQWLDRRPADADRPERDYVVAWHAEQRRFTRWRRATAAALVVPLVASGMLTVRTLSANRELDSTARRQAAQLLRELAERKADISPMTALQFALASWRHDLHLPKPASVDDKPTTMNRF